MAHAWELGGAWLTSGKGLSLSGTGQRAVRGSRRLLLETLPSAPQLLASGDVIADVSCEADHRSRYSIGPFEFE